MLNADLVTRPDPISARTGGCRPSGSHVLAASTTDARPLLDRAPVRKHGGVS